MDPMKSRMWIAAAALAAAVVFLVMVTGARAPAGQSAAPAPVASSEAVLASDGGPPEDGPSDGTADADREEVIDALQGLLDALGISAQELADCGGANSGGAGNNGGGNNDGGDNDGGNSGTESGSGRGNGCAEPGAATEPAAGGTITIAAFAFGQPLTVAPGATVEVVNTDAAPHNVTAADGSFETPDLNQGDTATFTAPTAPGRYEFSCTLHPEMTGTLIVAGGAGGGAGSRAGDANGARPSAPAADPQRGGGGAGTSGGGDHDARPQQHGSTAPQRGTADGY
jgi:plastocyanin